MRVGVDIVDIDRIANWISTDRERLNRIFTRRELDYIHGKNWAAETVAGMFCAKEAFFKAIGTGIIPSKMLEIEVLHDHQGVPYFKMSPRIVNDHRLSTAKISLSISHTKTTIAIAVCNILHIENFI